MFGACGISMGLDIRSVTAKKTQLESIVCTDEKALRPKDANDADAMEFVGGGHGGHLSPSNRQ